ncbi:DUF3078 domain-containing protein [Ulvibacter sp.]|nr:DUF3078 domain-containing protein [Ulvibacter sp.]
MKKILITLVCLFSITFSFSQDKEALNKQKAEKQAEVDKYQGEVDAIQSQIDALPGWRYGAFGTLGGSISEFNNWYAQGSPNNSSGNMGFTVNGYANKIEDTYFWRNSLTLNLNWVKLDDKDDETDDENFKPTTDVFNISSLYGYELTEKWALSAFGEYRTTILDNFNDPGYLDLGIGITWTPIKDLIVVIHPLNYNFVFADDTAIFASSLGAKIVADYTKKIGQLNIKSNLSVFQSYKSEDLSNWTWTNSLGYTVWKNIGVGLDFGLRDNKQEALNYFVNTLETNDTFETVDNKLQTFWTFGLSYNFD